MTESYIGEPELHFPLIALGLESDFPYVNGNSCPSAISKLAPTEYRLPDRDRKRSDS
jgi:hypothetical protein